MDLSDVELRENLPIGILVDSNPRILDKQQFQFALSGIDFETCATMACVREVVRLSPIQVILAERNFSGGTISDIVSLARDSEKKFKVVLWAEKRDGLTIEILKKAGITCIILKNQPFDKILSRVKTILKK